MSSAENYIMKSLRLRNLIRIIKLFLIDLIENIIICVIDVWILMQKCVFFQYLKLNDSARMLKTFGNIKIKI